MDLLLGAPGTGKTTALVNKIQELKPDHFALLSFTRQAANEAKAKLSKLYSEKELDWIRTIHSLAFKVLRLNRGSMFTDNHLKDFGNEYGFEFSNKYFYEEDGTFDDLTEDDITYRQMQIVSTLDKEGNEYLYNNPEIDEEQINHMHKKYMLYKYQKDLVDFNDILKLCVTRQLPKFDLLCIDEAQDLSPLQFAVIDKIAAQSNHVIYAGDDDQMIYEWSGVKREQFMKLAESSEKEILVKNHRIPYDIINKSEKIISRCRNRIIKSSTSDRNTPVATNNMTRIYDLAEIERFDPTKSYLILARNNIFLRDVRMLLDDLGLEWGYLKAREKKPVNIHISTIHGSKGAEADVVILLTDVTNSTYQNITSDSEHRVWYVGMTRTRNQLIIVDSQGKYSYDL